MAGLVASTGQYLLLLIISLFLLIADVFAAKFLLSPSLFSLYVAVSLIIKIGFITHKTLDKFFVTFTDRFKNLKRQAYYHLVLTFFFQGLLIALVLESISYITYFGIENFSPQNILAGTALAVSGVSIFLVLSYYVHKSITKKTKAFFVPRVPSSDFIPVTPQKNIALVIPTYKPTIDTYNLVTTISKWFPQITIVVVDDFTPLTPENEEIINKIKEYSRNNYKVIVFRTPENQLKAGALNNGIDYLKILLPYTRPDVVFTFDDDVVIERETIPNMVEALFSDPKIGIVCSQVRILNKNKNFLTRMQGLEYNNFNISKIADNGLSKGPLVMQGMLTAIKMPVLEKIGGFSVGHLIEDYDLTVRTKIKGWEVRIAQNAVAWTKVPESFGALWKQRARWTSGGLRVITQNWRWFSAVYQDLMGHATFISLVLLVSLSFYFAGTYKESPFTPIMVGLSIINFIAIFSYSIMTMLAYKDRDKKDWLLKLSLIPEFLYANMMTLILLGAYLFMLYNAFVSGIINTINFFYRIGQSGFAKVGYSSNWGTR
jgi:cellulose synthase/poly-beta-1,6-N-acetylglucosamine synthase-like glycosyltransferase